MSLPASEVVALSPPKPRSLADSLRYEWRLGHHPPLELAAILTFALGVFLILTLGATVALGMPPAWLADWARPAALGLAALGCICILWGTLVEPQRLRVREIPFRSPKVRGRPLRLAHLSDLHVRTWGPYESRVVATVRSLAPDAILLTGDYTAWPGVPSDAERLLRELAALAPCFAVRGNREMACPLSETGPGPQWLRNRAVRQKLAGTALTVLGVDPGDEDFVRGAEPADPGRFSILLYHYPDFIPCAAELPYDLMLCGHTHGGQIRLPWIGALASLSRAGTRYAAGLFQVDGRAAYVTHGIGTESYGLPPMRFLCPPEIALLIVQAP